jgi:hypothetical protein
MLLEKAFQQVAGSEHLKLVGLHRLSMYASQKSGVVNDFIQFLYAIVGDMGFGSLNDFV